MSGSSISDLLLRARSFLFSKKGVFLCVGILVLVGAVSVFVYTSTSGSAAYDPEDPAYNRTYWKEQVERKGAKAAYAQFKKVTETAPEGKRHFSAHVMGSVIGEVVGPEGIAVCDPVFGFGCYHGFFGEVISTGGLALVKELDQACVEAHGVWGTGCQHGIGHGILEYVGYTKLAEALEICKETSQPTPLLGCTSGVLMEYDFPLSEGNTTSMRPFDPAHPYAPCDTLTEEFQDVCYVELGQWYKYSFGSDAAQLGDLCSALPERARTHCFLGIGSVQGSGEQYDPAKAVTICEQFSAEDELRCRAGVWWSFYQVPEERAKGEGICTYPDAARTEKCLTLGDFTGGMIRAR